MKGYVIMLPYNKLVIIIKCLIIYSVIASILLLLSDAVSACDNWNKQDTARELGYYAVHYIDYKQTVEIATNPAFIELNPILGKHPSTKKVKNYFLLTTGIHSSISCLLPSESRKFWQNLSLIITTGIVTNNYMIGLRW